MNPAYILFLVGGIYVLFLGGMSFLRREGISTRFAIEAIIITLIFGGLALTTGFAIHPAIFLIVIYLITMRARLMIDLANSYARRKNFSMADRLYQTALKLYPDPTNQALIHINRAVSKIQQGELDLGIQIITQQLPKREAGYMGVKTEAACYYNLAIAYRRKNQESMAANYFNKVLETWPASVYGRAATAALKKEKPAPPGEVKNPE